MKRLALIMVIVFISLPLYAAHIQKEKYYQNKWCKANNGVTEYVLDDKTRVDCLTDEYAVEVEFASKIYQSVGQALYYAVRTGKKPGVVLIMEKLSDGRHLEKLETIAMKYGIRIWTIQAER